jgi:hypothetical protein
MRDCYVVSYEGEEPEMTLSEKYAGTEIGELLKVKKKKDVFPVEEDCLADHRNSWDFQCRDAKGEFSEVEWGASTVTPHCIKMNAEYSEHTIDRCGGDGLAHYVGVFADPAWLGEWLTTFKRRGKMTAAGASAEAVGLALETGGPLGTAAKCQQMCRQTDRCKVFTFYATDGGGENVLDRCFLFSDTLDCEEGKNPMDRMPGATAGYAGKYGC